MPLPHEPGPHWGEVGIHGLHRQREWDTITTVGAPALTGDEAWLVALPDGRVVVEEGPPDLEPDVLLAAVRLSAPYRAHAVRRDGAVWVVAARAIEIVDLVLDPGGDEIELAWDGAERTVRIDDAPTLAGVPGLEAVGAGRHATYIVTAHRLEGTTWEVDVAPL